MDIKTLVYNGLASTALNGGATLNPKTGENVTTGFATGGFREYKYASPSLADLDEILGDVTRMVEALPECMVGFWMHKNMLYIDAVKVFKDEDTARFIGKAMDEIAIFDLSTNTEITL